MCVNPEPITAEWKGAYPDHRQKNADGAKDGLGRRRTRDLFREIHGLDGRIQQGEDVIPTFLSFGILVHGRRSW